MSSASKQRALGPRSRKRYVVGSGALSAFATKPPDVRAGVRRAVAGTVDRRAGDRPEPRTTPVTGRRSGRRVAVFWFPEVRQAALLQRSRDTATEASVQRS